jgi:addiction module HigA family antidote
LIQLHQNNLGFRFLGRSVVYLAILIGRNRGLVVNLVDKENIGFIIENLNPGKCSMSQYPGNFAIAVHPGDILREMLDERHITQTRLAMHLGTDVARINEVCRRRRGVSATMAILLAKAFGTSAGLWMQLQKNWELSQVDQNLARHVKPLRKSA